VSVVTGGLSRGERQDALWRAALPPGPWLSLRARAQQRNMFGISTTLGSDRLPELSEATTV
jgi:hypothetical protein